MSSGEPKAVIPQDQRGLRQNNLDLLNWLLFNQKPGTGGARGFGGSISGIQNLLQRQKGGLGGGDVTGRLEQFFGTLGSPQSALQMQGADALGQMLRQPTPEQRAFDISLPQLQEMLTGQGPQFERDLALANQQGGRFGSANAILRGEATRNLYNLRNQVAQTLGLLGQGAGGANRALAGQAFATGQAQAGQADIETQRRLQILMQLLGVGQQTSFNVPIQQGGGFFQDLLGAAGAVLPFLGGGPAGAATAASLGLGGQLPFNPPVFGSSGLGNRP